MDKEGDRETGLRLVSGEEEEDDARSTSGLIKLKIPKIQSFTKEDVDGAKDIGIIKEEEEHGDQKHVCTECGKRFRSGKALGGHKRIHVHETKKFMEKPRTIPSLELPVESRAVDRSTGQELEVACCVCGKKFPSMKALYGHMRFHPDRGWRGVQPPPRAGSSSSTLSDDHDQFGSDDDDDDDDEYSEFSDWDSEAIDVPDAVDLKESLKGWSVTGKRGRRSILKTEARILPEEDIQEAVNDLLMLANGEANQEKPRKSDVLESSPYTEEKFLEHKTLKRRKKKRRLSDMEKEPNMGQLDVHSSDIIKPCEAGVRERHICLTCNKSFPSYQALGGHRASHNKIKNEHHHQQNSCGEIYTLLGSEATGLASAQGSNASVSSNGDHKCNICHKSFQTGQALGGHKRRHWNGPTEAAASSSSQATELTHETKPRRMVLNIDLNQPPPEEEEDEERVTYRQVIS